MAAGDTFSDSSGNEYADADGNAIADDGSGNCCKRQARSCDDDSLADLWLADVDIPSFPYYVKRDEDDLCYHFEEADQANPCPDLPPIGGVQEADDCACCFARQARKCSDDTLADIWLEESEIPAFPYYVKRAVDEICYYFLDSDPAEPCGTHEMMGPVAAFTSCDDCLTDTDCPRHECITNDFGDGDVDMTLCDADHGAPNGWLVTIDGWSPCECVFAPGHGGADLGSYASITTDLNGTYLIGALTDGCFYQYREPFTPVDGFLDQQDGATPPAECVTPRAEFLRIQLHRANLNVGFANDFYPDDSHWTFVMFGSHRNSGSQLSLCGSRYFFGRCATAAADCLEIPTITNELECVGYEPDGIGGCPHFPGDGGGQDLGIGGTADFTCFGIA